MTAVSAYFDRREAVWEEPIYRNVWGLLREFGDAEIAAGFYLPAFNKSGPGFRKRGLFIETCSLRPRVDGPPTSPGNKQAAPGKLPVANSKSTQAEIERAEGLLKGELAMTPVWAFSQGFSDPFIFEEFYRSLTRSADTKVNWNSPLPVDRRKDFDPAVRQKRQFDQLVDFTQKLMRDSEQRRAKPSGASWTPPRRRSTQPPASHSASNWPR